MSINVLLMPFFIQLGMNWIHCRLGCSWYRRLLMALLAPLTGWMSERFLPERLCSLGLIINALAFLSLSFLSAETTAFTVILWLSVLGFGMGLFQDPEQQLVDELTSTPTPGSRIVFFVDRP